MPVSQPGKAVFAEAGTPKPMARLEAYQAGSSVAATGPSGAGARTPASCVRAAP
jgi:hypothetical protein